MHFDGWIQICTQFAILASAYVSDLRFVVEPSFEFVFKFLVLSLLFCILVCSLKDSNFHFGFFFF